MRVYTSLTGSSSGFSYKLERVSSDNTASVAVTINSDNGVTIDSNGYLTTLADKLGAGSYQLTIYTNENSKIKTVVQFTIEEEKTSVSGDN